MDGDDESFEKEVNYRRICKDIIRNLRKIKDNLWVLDKMKLAGYQDKALLELEEDLNQVNYTEYNHDAFIELMDLACQFEELLADINSSVGELTRKVNNPSETDKENINSYFDIETITPRFKALANDFTYGLNNLLRMIQKLLDKYITYYKDEAV